jgi:hypothetical protein
MLKMVMLAFLSITTKNRIKIHPQQRRQKCLLVFLSSIIKNGVESILSNSAKNASVISSWILLIMTVIVPCLF